MLQDRLCPDVIYDEHTYPSAYISLKIPVLLTRMDNRTCIIEGKSN